jgi:hypothetical protein
LLLLLLLLSQSASSVAFALGFSFGFLVFCFRAPDPCACYEIQETEQLDALCAIVFGAPPPGPFLFLIFSVCFSCFSFCLLCVLFLFRGGVRQGVGEEEEEEEEERERRRYGDENVLVFKMSFSSHGFPRRVPGIVSLGRKQRKAFFFSSP